MELIPKTPELIFELRREAPLKGVSPQVGEKWWRKVQMRVRERGPIYS